MFAFGEKARVVREAITFILDLFFYLSGYLAGEIIQLFFFCLYTSMHY